MKNLKRFAYKCAGIMCMAAMIISVHSVNVMCHGKYYQPVVPKELDKFRKNQEYHFAKMTGI